MTDIDFDGVPLHPLADQFTMPKTDTPGQCACGAVLPPMREWDDYPHQWGHTTCKQCGRGFVDEDDYIAIYDDGLDLDDDGEAGGATMTGMCPHCGEEVEIREGLTAYHNWPKPLRQFCPGSKQNARCAESDARPLWNGEPNLRFAGGSNGTS